MAEPSACYLGIDFGTSGARAAVIDDRRETLAELRVDYEAGEEDLARTWQTALFDLLAQLPLRHRRGLKAVANDGTSATSLLCDAANRPLCPALLYNDARARKEAEELKRLAPSCAVVQSPSSSLAKLLWYDRQPESRRARYFLHQADWLAALLHGRPGFSDYHNSLKLGFDVERMAYPAWLQRLPSARLLPKIVAPGALLGHVLPEVARQFGINRACEIRAGTTDSIAAFLASGANQPGHAVTSLGSTMALKLLSRTRVDSPEYGIYSHRLGELWLAGGASNAGGMVLKQFFTDGQLAELSARIDPTRASDLDYYPLPAPGERFPVNDPSLLPRLEPRPADDAVFLQGLLEGLARIEHRGYQLLQDLGATPVKSVQTAGGGAKNRIWTAIRERLLGIAVSPSPQTEAAYGSALLAAAGEKLLSC